MRYLVAALLLLSGCAGFYDMKIHRMDGTVEVVEAMSDGGADIHTVCKETGHDVYGRTLECQERHLN